jgi:hypothetical protein
MRFQARQAPSAMQKRNQRKDTDAISDDAAIGEHFTHQAGPPAM